MQIRSLCLLLSLLLASTHAAPLKQEQFSFDFFQGLGEDVAPYFEFTLGFLAGALPTVATYFEDDCVRHSGEFFSDSLQIYILTDKVAKGMA